MSWLSIALLAQFVLGTSAVFDKLLLKRSFSDPLSYTFWLGIVSLLSFVLAPFGFESISASFLLLALVAGSVFMLAMLAYFWALHLGEASGAIVAIRGFSPLATLALGALLIGGSLASYEYVAFIFLVLGGFILSAIAERQTRFRVFLLVLLSAFLFGASNVLAKLVFDAVPFITAFIWMKVGGAFFVLLFLFRPSFRPRVLEPVKSTFRNKGFYLLNRGYAGAGSLLVFYAISLGSPALTEAMQSTQFLFIFLGGWLILGERFRGKILLGKVTAFVLISIGVFLLGVGGWVRATAPDPARAIAWGVTFSEQFSRRFDFGEGKTWQDNYDAILNDLGARRIRLIAYWDLIEKEDDVFDFGGLDYQMRRAEEVGALAILVVGKKVPRWPECHIPRWARETPNPNNQFPTVVDLEVLEFVEVVVNRYKNSPALTYWQVENEPFLPFGEGECALTGGELLEKEIALVRSLDPTHPILITDSGEIGPWVRAAKRGDAFGASMYRRVHNDTFGNVEYPIGPWFFRIKEKIVRFLISDYEKKFIVVELGAEPWLKRQLYETTPEEQFAVFDFAFFKDTIRFAKATSFDEYYLWGAEWYWWLREKHNDPRFWDEAKILFRE